MSNQKKIKEVSENIAAKEARYLELTEAGNFTTEIRSELDTLKTEITDLKADLKIYSEAENIEGRAAMPVSFTTQNTTEKEVKRFSLAKFINEASKEKLTGFEAEMHQEAVSEARGALSGTGSDFNASGFGIPQFVLDNMGKRFEKRAQSAGTDSEGGYAVETTVGALIEPLYPNPIVAQMGATVFDNLTGNLTFPRDTNLFSFAWESEISASDDTSKTFAQVSLSPKRVAGRADVSRRLLIQEKSGKMEQYLMGEFLRGINVAVDVAAINGSGSGNQPTGVLNTSGVSNIVLGANGAVPTWEQLLRFPKQLDQADALNGNLGWIATPEMKSILMSTLKNATYGTTGYIWETDNQLAGYKAMASTSVPQGLTQGSSSICHAMAFGNWSDLLIGKWGGTFVLVDPYTQATTSQVRIHCELQMDVAVRRAASFAITKSAINGLGS